jgi:hypothetical protein
MSQCANPKTPKDFFPPFFKKLFGSYVQMQVWNLVPMEGPISISSCSAFDIDLLLDEVAYRDSNPVCQVQMLKRASDFCTYLHFS